MPRYAAAAVPLDAYLRRATLGLPREVAQQVRDELEEHALNRAAQLELQGYSASEALARAVAELGPPLAVTAGMNQVHNMPKLLSLGTLVALSAGTLLYALAGGRAAPEVMALPILTQAPTKPTCVRGTVPSRPDLKVVSRQGDVTCYITDDRTRTGIFLSHPQLVHAVHAQGGHVTMQPGGRVRVSFPGGTWMTLRSRFTVSGQQYYPASMVASSLSGMFRPDRVSVSGYARPVLQGGPVRLQFGNGNQNIGALFYQDFGSEFVYWLLSNKQTEDTGMNLSWTPKWSDGLTDVRHRIQTGQQPGEVVMLVMRNAGGNYFTTFAPVAADGTATFQDIPEHLRFVPSIADLGPHLSGGRSSALLVRVTNLPLTELKKGIFVPAQATSDAL